MLTTNQIRKVSGFSFFLSFKHDCESAKLVRFFLFSFFFNSQDLSSPSMYDTGVALTGLSCFVTPDLARDLANDIMTLVSHREGSAPSERTNFVPHSSIVAALWCFRALKCELLSSLQMSHTKPYIRKKAVLIMYKVFLKYPESLRPAFPRLKEKLEDPDPGTWKTPSNHGKRACSLTVTFL